MAPIIKNTEEQTRIKDRDAGALDWERWGTYVSERMWGTVREDYSANGDAWRYLSHDMARSVAYRWGEDGLAGLCDRYQLAVFSLALWNGKDPILKERLFGLNPYEGNHGEDVKEYYYYLDATPTQSYMKYLYRYPHNAFPYDELVQENQKRTTHDGEFELVDTKIFEENRYFDVVVEYAKKSPSDIAIRIEIKNRSKEAASIHVIPQIWFRKTWGWDPNTITTPPVITEGPQGPSFNTLFLDTTNVVEPERVLAEYKLPHMYLYGQTADQLLFTNNETNNIRAWKTETNPSNYVKDAFHRFIIDKEACVNSEKRGTKACFHYADMTIAGESSKVLLLRLTDEVMQQPLDDVEKIVAQRKSEADSFYAAIQPENIDADLRLIQRQAFAGMIWGKQFYLYDVNRWLRGDNPEDPPPASRYHIRNNHWKQLFANSIISMPDKWEYPWFAAWDLSFHAVALSCVDMYDAKKQLFILLSHRFQHPNGQLPAYEWRFSDLNPPTQAWALWYIYKKDKEANGGKGDYDFLERCFLKLTYNFAWWVNKVDRLGNNFFEGGFLGLDNISIIDRSKPLPGGGQIEQSDGTGWMAFFSLMLMRCALELAKGDANYETLALTFYEHFVYIAATMSKSHSLSMWDEADGFFYDIVSYPDGRVEQLKIRSLVGLIPFFSIDCIHEDELRQYPYFYKNFQIFTAYHKEKTKRCVFEINDNGSRKFLLTLIPLHDIPRVLEKVWDPNEFRSPFGLRSVSLYHRLHPFTYGNVTVSYEPGESLERIKGGNSNWRGPVWFPPNFIFIEALKKLSSIMGNSMLITAPDTAPATLDEMAQHFTQSLITIFSRDSGGARPVQANICQYAQDPLWKDLLTFNEYYHADTGKGLGALHQTGWSGLVINLINDKTSYDQKHT